MRKIEYKLIQTPLNLHKEYSGPIYYKGKIFNAINSKSGVLQILDFETNELEEVQNIRFITDEIIYELVLIDDDLNCEIKLKDCAVECITTSKGRIFSGVFKVTNLYLVEVNGKEVTMIGGDDTQPININCAKKVYMRMEQLLNTSVKIPTGITKMKLDFIDLILGKGGLIDVDSLNLIHLT